MRIQKTVKKKLQTPSQKRNKIETLREACEEEYGDPPWTSEQILKVSKRMKNENRKSK